MQWNFSQFLTFAFIMCITPGPNNTLLLATGINYGFKKALPALFGVIVSFGGLVALCGFGVGALLQQHAALETVMLYIGAGFLCYLGYKIATSKTVLQKGELGSKPIIGFWQAVALQFINPKTWTMAIMASSLFMPTGIVLWQAVLLLALTFALTFLPCGSLWILGGVGLRRIMRSERHMQTINIVLGLALVLLAVWLVLSHHNGVN